MSNINEIINSYAQKIEISKEEYETKQAELSKEEFSKTYRKEEFTFSSPYAPYSKTEHYYYIETNPMDEIHMLMLYDLLKETRTVAEKTSFIATVLMVGLVAGGVLALITFIMSLSSVLH